MRFAKPICRHCLDFYDREKHERATARDAREAIREAGNPSEISKERQSQKIGEEEMNLQVWRDRLRSIRLLRSKSRPSIQWGALNVGKPWYWEGRVSGKPY